jgi:hypothetical protein
MNQGVIGSVFVNLEEEGDNIVINGRKEMMFNSDELRLILDEVTQKNNFRCRFLEKDIVNLPTKEFLERIGAILMRADLVILFTDFAEAFLSPLLFNFYQRLETANSGYPVILINWRPRDPNNRFKKCFEENARVLIKTKDINEIKSELEKFLRSIKPYVERLSEQTKNKLNRQGIEG